jgi:hypothetical protein
MLLHPYRMLYPMLIHQLVYLEVLRMGELMFRFAIPSILIPKPPVAQYLVQHSCEFGPRDCNLHRPACAATCRALRQHSPTIWRPVRDGSEYVFLHVREWEFSIAPSGPDSYRLALNITSLIEFPDGAVANFSNVLGDHGYGYGAQFGGKKASKEDLPNIQCEIAYDVVILQLSDEP